MGLDLGAVYGNVLLADARRRVLDAVQDKQMGEDCVRVAFGETVRCPSAGIIVESPLEWPLRHIVVDGRHQPATDPRRITLVATAAEVILDYGP